MGENVSRERLENIILKRVSGERLGSIILKRVTGFSCFWGMGECFIGASGKHDFEGRFRF